MSFGDPSTLASDVTAYAADGTYAEVLRYQYADGTHRIVQRIEGTWTLDAVGARLRMSHPIPDELPSTSLLDVRDGGRTLVGSAPGGDFVYKKQ